MELILALADGSIFRLMDRSSDGWNPQRARPNAMNKTRIATFKVRGHDLLVTAEAIDRSVRKSSCISSGNAFDRFCEERLRRARPLAVATPSWP
jgi:hypothetical protein